MRRSPTGRKLYTRNGIEGYSISQINFARKIRDQIGFDFWMRVQAHELSDEEIATAKEIMKHKEAGWWIARRHATIWVLLREQEEKGAATCLKSLDTMSANIPDADIAETIENR
jgi:hypothetical protein